MQSKKNSSTKSILESISPISESGNRIVAEKERLETKERSFDSAGIKDTSGQDRQLTNVSTNRAKIIFISISIAFTIAAIWFLSEKAGDLFSADRSASRKNIRTAIVEQGNLQRNIAVQGRIIASNSPTLYTTATGTISLSVKAGQTVNKGQLIAELDSPELESQLDQQKAQLEELQLENKRQEIQIKSALLDNQQQIEMAKVDLALAKKNIERAKLNIDLKVISQVDYETQQAELEKIQLQHKHAIENAKLQKENYEFELAAKKLQLERQQFVVSELERQVSALSIRSPLDGVVGSLMVSEKDTVASNTPIITLVDLSAYEVEISIPESYADDLGVGLAVEMTIENTNYPGELIAISPEVNNGQVQGRVKFAQIIPKGIRQNQRVSSKVLIETRNNVIKVARGSFVESGGSRLAYIIKGDLATRHEVQLGAKSVNEVEIVSGLKPGDEIIISDLEPFISSQTVYLSN